MRFFTQKLSQTILIILLPLAVFIIFSLPKIVSAKAPFITENWNSKTKDASLNINVQMHDLIVFKVVSNQTIDTWYWLIDGVLSTEYNTNAFTFRARLENRVYAISVYGANGQGNTPVVTWNVHVSALGQGNISGIVSDNLTNLPLQGATIISGSYMTTTDIAGQYSFNNVKEGDYIFTVSKSGYDNKNKNIKVIAGQTTSQNLQLIPYATPIITFDGTKIKIGAGSANLTAINQTLNNPALLEQLSPKEWLLKVPIEIGDLNGRLYINDSDTSWLKLLSLNNSGGAYIFNSRGILVIDNTKITSWNSSTSLPAPVSDTVRAYIHTEGKGRTNIYNSNISHLGPGGVWGRQGLSWHSANDFEVAGNTMTDVRSLYVYRSNNIIIKNNYFEIYSDAVNVYFSGTLDTGNAIFENNIVHYDNNHNGEVAVVSGKNFSIINNTFYGASLRFLNDSHDSFVSGNEIVNAHAHGPFELHGSDSRNINYFPWNIIVEKNVVHNTDCTGESLSSCHGIYIHNVGIHDITINNNTVYDVTGVNFYLYEGYNLTMYNNTGWGSRSEPALFIGDVYDSLIYNNNLTGVINPSTGVPGADIYIFEDPCGGDYVGCWGTRVDNIIFTNNILNNKKIVVMNGLNGAITFKDTKTKNGTPYSFISNINSTHTDNYNFQYTDGAVFSITGGTVTYTPLGSNISLLNLNSSNNISSRTIVYFPMTILPISGSATVSVASFNTSLPLGSVLANFTADTTNGNNVTFTASTLKPDTNYLIKKGNVDYVTAQADSTGKITFANSVWPSANFTIIETIGSMPTPTPSITPTPSLTITPSLTPTPTITPTPAPKLSADLNSDGSVNAQDFAILMSAWNSIAKPKADINQDGLVDSLDFGLMMSFWG